MHNDMAKTNFGAPVTYTHRQYNWISALMIFDWIIVLLILSKVNAITFPSFRIWFMMITVVASSFHRNRCALYLWSVPLAFFPAFSLTNSSYSQALTQFLVIHFFWSTWLWLNATSSSFALMIHDSNYALSLYHVSINNQ